MGTSPGSANPAGSTVCAYQAAAAAPAMAAAPLATPFQPPYALDRPAMPKPTRPATTNLAWGKPRLWVQMHPGIGVSHAPQEYPHDQDNKTDREGQPIGEDHMRPS